MNCVTNWEEILGFSGEQFFFLFSIVFDTELFFFFAASAISYHVGLIVINWNEFAPDFFSSNFSRFFPRFIPREPTKIGYRTLDLGFWSIISIIKIPMSQKETEKKASTESTSHCAKWAKWYIVSLVKWSMVMGNGNGKTVTLYDHMLLCVK